MEIDSQKLKKHHIEEAVLVTPLWTMQFWWPLVESLGEANTDEDKHKMDIDRMEIINNKRVSSGLNLASAEFCQRR